MLDDDEELLTAPLRDDEETYPEESGWIDLTGAGICVLAQGEA